MDPFYLTCIRTTCQFNECRKLVAKGTNLNPSGSGEIFVMSILSLQKISQALNIALTLPFGCLHFCSPGNNFQAVVN